jgi:hypothetical protein
MFFFERLTANRFSASEHVGGAWNPAEQHIAPALGLIAHAIETDHAARRPDRLKIARLSYDILGTLPIGVVDINITVTRPGRTIELVEARLSHGGRDAVVARAWLLQAFDTDAIAGSAMIGIAPPDAFEEWRPETIWAGGFIRTVEVRRSLLSRGRATSWVRTQADLIAGEAVSATAAALTIVDIANGLAPWVAIDEASFPNVDLTVHLFEQPRGAWLGLDTIVSFGAAGVGLTHSIMHDEQGPIGTVSQSLTIRRL